MEAPNLSLPILDVLFALYLLLISVKSLPKDSSTGHFKYVIHMAFLLFVACLSKGSMAIMPSASLTTTEHSTPGDLWYPALALHLVAFVIVINIPRGPPLYFPPNQIYAEKWLGATTAMKSESENVCGIVNASIWQILFFSYTTKVTF